MNVRSIEAERFSRLFVQICPFRVGQRVTVSPACKYAPDWTEEYIITGIRWMYRDGEGHGINISIASDDDIVNRWGDTDGFGPEDLLPASRT